MHHIIDNEKLLIGKIAEGDEAAYQQLFNAYWNKVYSVAFAYLKHPEQAEDVTQEIFLKLWNRRSTLPQVDAFENYLFIVTRNDVFKALQKKGPVHPVGPWLENTLEETEPSPELALRLKQLQELVGKAVELLPAQQQIAWKLSREQGLSYEEVAEQMQVARNTAKNHIIRSLNFVRTYVAEHSDHVTVGMAAYFFL